MLRAESIDPLPTDAPVASSVAARGESPRGPRVVVLVDQVAPPRAVARRLKSLLHALGGELAGTVVLDPGPLSPAARLFEGWASLAGRRHNAGEDSAGGWPGRDGALSGPWAATLRDGALVPGVPALKALRRLAPGLLLCFTRWPPVLPADIAPLGALGIEAGHGVPLAAGWAGAAALAADDPQMLRVVDYRGAPHECYVAVLPVAATAMPDRLREALWIQGAAALQRVVQDHARGIRRPVAPRLLSLVEPRSPPLPPSLPLLAGVLREGARRWRRRFGKGKASGGDGHPPWHIAYVFTDLPLPEVPFADLRYLVAPGAGFWADPFALHHAGRHWILFEDLPAPGLRGRLRAVEVRELGEAGPPVTVLERPCHLSYPQVFSLGGRLYLLPETRQAGRIELLRCIVFPGEWETACILLDGVHAVDATLWHDPRGSGRWWLFANLAADPDAAANELHLYWADDLCGPWQAHAANPVGTDVRCARPAGPLFESGGELFRPSQDGGRCYGESIWINRITRLDPEHFQEQPVRHITAAWHPAVRRIHTLGRAGRLTVLDCVIEGRHDLPVQRFD